MPLSFNVPDSVLSTTLANYSKTLQENIFRANPLFFYLIGQYPEVAGQEVPTRGQLKILTGGESIVQPLLYEKNSTAKPYSKYGIIDVTPQEGLTAARFVWKQVAASIAISGLEERQNAGSETRIIDLMATKTMQAEMSLKEELNSEAFSANGDGSQGITGLQTICSNTSTTGGIATGTTTNTWWQAKVNSTSTSFSAAGIDAMRTKYNDVTRGTDKCDLIITDQPDFERYERVLQPQERFTDSVMADGGFQNLKFKGAPVTFDLYCPTGQMFFLNSKYLNLQVHADANFSTTDFVKPDNQDAKVAQILFMGELTVSNRSRQGVITTLTA